MKRKRPRANPSTRAPPQIVALAGAKTADPGDFNRRLR
jgi:hypothetical protein